MNDDRGFDLGSATWPGVSKVIEETGELSQVLGKLIATGGETQHWDGSDLMVRLVEEIADVQAAIDFLVQANGLPAAAIADRRDRKFRGYLAWHRQAAAERAGIRWIR